MAPAETELTQRREHIEPWLSALLQAEHLNLPVGSGLTAAIAEPLGAPVVDMAPVGPGHEYEELVLSAAECRAEISGRGKTNVEDMIRATGELM